MEQLIENLNITSNRYLNALIIFGAFVLTAIVLNLFLKAVIIKLFKIKVLDIPIVIRKLRMPIFYIFLLLGVIFGSKLLEFEPKNRDIFENILLTVITLISMVATIKVSNVIIQNAVISRQDNTGLGKDIIPLAANFSKIIVVIGAAALGIAIWGLDLTPLLASAGVASVIIAFAAKDTFANFFGGISVFMDKPYQLGDYINLESGERGEVVAIGMRSTRIKTRDDIIISMPNSIISNQKIINESAPVTKYRMRIPVGVAYGSDIDLVEEVLLSAALENPRVATEPDPRVRFREFGNSSLNFELLCWGEIPAQRGITSHELNKSIYRKFEENNIKIPFPQRDVHFYDHSKDDEG
ncbi:MAG: mechanosensitive ion channel family protein [Bacteroidota bacterium]